MDDDKFDDIIKQKVEVFEGEPFDPAALADLHHRLSQDFSPPWYITYKTALIASAAVILICLFNFGLFHYYSGFNSGASRIQANDDEKLKNENDYRAIDTVIIKDSEYESEIIALSEQIKKLSDLNSSVMATLIASANERLVLTSRIAELERKFATLDVRDTLSTTVSEDRSVLTAEILKLKQELSDLSKKSDGLLNMQNRSYNTLVRLGNVEDISPKVLSQLRENNLLKEEDGIAYLKSNDDLIPLVLNQKGNKKGEQIVLLLPASEQSNEYIAALDSMKNVKKLPVHLQREIERHYSKGIGIKIAPTLGANLVFHEKGAGQLAPTLGIKSDFILSPSLSLETGLNYVHQNNKMKDSDEINEVAKPDFDPSRGTLVGVDVETEFIEVPVNLKYRYPLAKGNLFASVGASAAFYSDQAFYYSQNLEVNSQILRVNSEANVIPENNYLTFLNFNLGLTRLIKKENSLELSITYQHGIQDFGITEMKNNVLGIRTAYWFKIR